VSTVELQLSARPHHVRTARLVGVAAARRAGLPDELVDELRWALGEACSRAVALHAAHAPDIPVRVLVREDAGGLTVEVVDRGPEGLPSDGEAPEDLFEGEQVDPRVSLAVLDGLVDDVEISATGNGTTVRLRWPLPPRAV
jgi:anti-sigma regulatory factor (Ser/Thr protein kinase)